MCCACGGGNNPTDPVNPVPDGTVDPVDPVNPDGTVDPVDPEPQPMDISEAFSACDINDDETLSMTEFTICYI